MSITKRNYVYQIIYQVLVSILPFITSPYIARVLGADSIGIYSYTYSIVSYFGLFAMLGIFTYGNRAIAKAKNDQEELNKTFTSLYVLHVGLSVVALLAYVGYILVFIRENKLIAVVQTFYLLAQLFDINWFFFGMEKFKLTVTRNCIIKILTVILIFLLVNKKEDLWVYALIMSAGQLLSVFLIWPYLPKYARFCRVTLKEVFVHLKPMFILFFAVIATSVYSYMDKIMIGSMSSYEQLGFYENSWKMIEFPVGFITALGTVMMPKISNLITQHDDETINKYIYKSMRFSLIAACAIAFGVAAISTEFSVVFWGDDFAGCGIIMTLLSATIIIMSWNSVVRAQYLIPREHDRVYLIAVISGAVVNLLLNAFLIRRFGAAGASVATVLSYFTICMVQNCYSRRALSLMKFFFESVPYFIIGLIMYFIVRFVAGFMKVGICTLLVEVIVGALSYGVLTLIYALIKKDTFVIEIMINVKNKLLRKHV